MTTHLVTAALLRLWAELGPELAALREVRVAAGDYTLTLRAERTDIATLRPNERDVYAAAAALCRSLGRRVTAKEVKAELRRRKQEWGNTTVNNALALLVARGLLVNHHDRHGYGVPEGCGESADQAAGAVLADTPAEVQAETKIEDDATRF